MTTGKKCRKWVFEEKRLVGGIRCEARSRGYSSHDYLCVLWANIGEGSANEHSLAEAANDYSQRTGPPNRMD